jgi:NADPH:quinone reductase-like Zn-dependent oxidoreductase
MNVLLMAVHTMMERERLRKSGLRLSAGRLHGAAGQSIRDQVEGELDPPRRSEPRVRPDWLRASSLRLYENGKLAVHVAETIPFSLAAEAHRLVETGHVRGKVVPVHD